MGVSPFSHMCAEYRRQRTRTSVNSPTRCHREIIIFSVSVAKSLSSQSLEEKEAGSVRLKEPLIRFRGLQQSPAYWPVLRELELWWWPTLGYHQAGPHSYTEEDMPAWISSLCYGNSEAPVLSGYFLKSRCFLVVWTMCCWSPLLCLCNSWAMAQGVVGGRVEGSSVQYVRRSGWALQNFPDMRGGTWHKRLELHPPSLPASPWDMLAGQGERGKRPTAFASHIPLTLQEGIAVEDSDSQSCMW